MVVLFLYTAVSKLMDYSLFKEQIGSSPILAPVAPFLAWALPLGEIAVAVLAFIPKWRIWGLWASFALMLIFTGYIIAILNFSAEIPCSCGGILEKMDWNQHLVFNIVFTLLALLGALMERRNRRVKPTDTGSTAFHPGHAGS